MDCKYCFDAKERKHEKRFMKIETFKKVIEIIPFGSNVILHGGEAKLIGLNWITKATKIGKCKNIKFSIQTNARGLSDSIQDYDKLKINVGTSYDFLNDNENRGVISEKDKEVIIFKKNNIEVLDLLNSDPKEVMKNFKKTKTAYNFKFITNETEEEINKMAENYLEYFKLFIFSKEKKTERSISNYLSLLFQTSQKNCDFSFCLGNILSLDLDGNIFICDRFAIDDKKEIIGNVKDVDDIYTILNSDKYIKIIEEVIEYKNKNCKTCSIEGLCNSVCASKVKCETGVYNGDKTSDCVLREKIVSGMFDIMKNLTLSQVEKLNNEVYIMSVSHHFPFSVAFRKETYE